MSATGEGVLKSGSAAGAYFFGSTFVPCGEQTDRLYGDDSEGWSAADIRVFDSDGKRSKTLALVMYRHARGKPSALGEFSVMTFDEGRVWPKYKP